MPRESKIIKALKEKEIQRFRKMSPQERINFAISHNNSIKSIFGIGLISKGFSAEQINSLWKNKKL